MRERDSGLPALILATAVVCSGVAGLVVLPGSTQADTPAVDTSDGDPTHQLREGTIRERGAVESVSVTNAPINSSDAGVEQTVTVRFSETMNTSAGATVTVRGIEAAPLTVDGGYDNDTTWTGTVTIPDDDEENRACVDVEATVEKETPTPEKERDATRAGGGEIGRKGECAGRITVDTVADVDTPESPGAIGGEADVTNLFELDEDVASTTYTYSAEGSTGEIETPTAFDTARFSDQELTIAVTATDRRNNTNSANLTVAVDNTPPAVTAFDATLRKGDGPPELAVTLASDDRLGSLAVAATGPEFRGTLEREEFEERETGSGYEYRFAEPIPTEEFADGTYGFSVGRVVDRAGNVNESVNATASVVVDLTPPTVEQTGVTDLGDANGTATAGERLEIAALLGGETDDVTAVTADASALGAGEVALAPASPSDLTETTRAQLQTGVLRLELRPRPFAGTVSRNPTFAVEVNEERRATFGLSGVSPYPPDSTPSVFERQLNLDIEAGDSVRIFPTVGAGNYDVRATIGASSPQIIDGVAGRDSDSSPPRPFEFTVGEQPEAPSLENETIYAGTVRVSENTPDGEAQLSVTATDDAGNADTERTRRVAVDTERPRITDAFILTEIAPRGFLADRTGPNANRLVADPARPVDGPFPQVGTPPFPTQSPTPSPTPDGESTPAETPPVLERSPTPTPTPVPERPERPPVVSVVVAEFSENVTALDRDGTSIRIQGIDPERIEGATVVKDVPESDRARRPVVGPPGIEELGVVPAPIPEPSATGDVVVLLVRGEIPTGDRPNLTFGAGAVTEASADESTNPETSTTLHTTRLDLREGKNLVSVPAAAGSLPLAEMDTSSVEGVWTYDSGAWRSWAPGAKTNDLRRLEGGQGYIFVMETNDTVGVNVRNVADEENRTVQRLEAGWNLVGHYRVADQPTVAAFASLFDGEPPGPVEAVLAQSPDSTGLEYTPVGAEDVIETGDAYWVNLTERTNYTQSPLAGEVPRELGFGIGETLPFGGMLS